MSQDIKKWYTSIPYEEIVKVARYFTGLSKFFEISGKRGVGSLAQMYESTKENSLISLGLCTNSDRAAIENESEYYAINSTEYGEWIRKAFLEYEAIADRFRPKPEPIKDKYGWTYSRPVEMQKKGSK